MLQPVIIAGGTGSRLWPMSRAHYPKQFLRLASENSLLQQTVKRIQGQDLAAPLVICNEEHRFVVAEQLREIDVQPSALILEPVGRNTAPAAALAALHAQAAGNDPVLALLPADHLISDDALFRDALAKGARLAEQGRMVVFGVPTSGPETGYGYIGRGEALQDGGFVVNHFEEKPELARAETLHADAAYFWNSGIFMFKASVFLDELEQRHPDLLKGCRAALAGAQADLDFLRVDTDAFTAVSSISIDYAVMEHTRLGAMVPMASGWSDLGSWAALWDAGNKDDAGNVTQGDVILEGVRDSLVYAQDRLVTVLDLDDVVVVETKDAVMVTRRESSQKVKGLVDRLRETARPEFCAFPKVHRPWGFYDSIASGHRFQAKHIKVKPGGRLSVQKHFHRAEHWIVVSGTAKVMRGEETYIVSENESTYIPLGVIHGLENPGKIDLELIEVQSGSYLDEDDIVRYEDAYGRRSEDV